MKNRYEYLRDFMPQTVNGENKLYKIKAYSDMNDAIMKAYAIDIMISKHVDFDWFLIHRSIGTTNNYDTYKVSHSKTEITRDEFDVIKWCVNCKELDIRGR